MDIKELQNLRDKHTTSFFWLGLEIALVFLVPALLAVYLGKKLDTATGASFWSILFLAITFALSWVWVGFKYNKKSKILKDIESQIVALRAIEDEKNKTAETIEEPVVNELDK